MGWRKKIINQLLVVLSHTRGFAYWSLSHTRVSHSSSLLPISLQVTFHFLLPSAMERAALPPGQ